uniref:Uncharacterized protein n=1 Tax=viral metagenome TaxID=1070528 RepID=A0A6M3IRH8_9ZZZZ
MVGYVIVGLMILGMLCVGFHPLYWSNFEWEPELFTQINPSWPILMILSSAVIVGIVVMVAMAIGYKDNYRRLR